MSRYTEEQKALLDQLTGHILHFNREAARLRGEAATHRAKAQGHLAEAERFDDLASHNDDCAAYARQQLRVTRAAMEAGEEAA